jgi:hypothetical protein
MTPLSTDTANPSKIKTQDNSVDGSANAVARSVGFDGSEQQNVIFNAVAAITAFYPKV